MPAHCGEGREEAVEGGSAAKRRKVLAWPEEDFEGRESV